MKAIELNNSNFDQETSEGVCLIDFWASWCGPCRMMLPVIEELAADYEGKAKIAKINVDENHGLAARFGVMTIPSIFVLKDGEIKGNFVGVQSKDVLVNTINSEL